MVIVPEYCIKMSIISNGIYCCYSTFAAYSYKWLFRINMIYSNFAILFLSITHYTYGI